MPANKWVPEADGLIWLTGPVADGFEYLLLVARCLAVLIRLNKDLGKRESLGSKVLILFVLISIEGFALKPADALLLPVS